MVDKPQTKREVSVDWIGISEGLIHFYASKDALEDIRDFGHIDDIGPNHYGLLVDTRFDFQEVLDYIKNYG